MHNARLMTSEKKRIYGKLVFLAFVPLALNQCAGTKNFISLTEAQQIVVKYLEEKKTEEIACCDRQTLHGEKTQKGYVFTMKGCSCPCIIKIEMDDRNGGMLRYVKCD